MNNTITHCRTKLQFKIPIQAIDIQKSTNTSINGNRNSDGDGSGNHSGNTNMSNLYTNNNKSNVHICQITNQSMINSDNLTIAQADMITNDQIDFHDLAYNPHRTTMTKVSSKDHISCMTNHHMNQLSKANTRFMKRKHIAPSMLLTIALSNKSPQKVKKQRRQLIKSLDIHELNQDEKEGYYPLKDLIHDQQHHYQLRNSFSCQKLHGENSGYQEEGVLNLKVHSQKPRNLKISIMKPDWEINARNTNKSYKTQKHNNLKVSAILAQAKRAQEVSPEMEILRHERQGLILSSDYDNKNEIHEGIVLDNPRLRLYKMDQIKRESNENEFRITSLDKARPLKLKNLEWKKPQIEVMRNIKALDEGRKMEVQQVLVNKGDNVESNGLDHDPRKYWGNYAVANLYERDYLNSQMSTIALGSPLFRQAKLKPSINDEVFGNAEHVPPDWQKNSLEIEKLINQLIEQEQSRQGSLSYLPPGYVIHSPESHSGTNRGQFGISQDGIKPLSKVMNCLNKKRQPVNKQVKKKQCSLNSSQRGLGLREDVLKRLYYHQGMNKRLSKVRKQDGNVVRNENLIQVNEAINPKPSANVRKLASEASLSIKPDNYQNERHPRFYCEKHGSNPQKLNKIQANQEQGLMNIPLANLTFSIGNSLNYDDEVKAYIKKTREELNETMVKTVYDSPNALLKSAKGSQLHSQKRDSANSVHKCIRGETSCIEV